MTRRALVTARAIFDADLASRDLDLPADLVPELRQLLATPRVSQNALWDRLLRGCEVLAANGDDRAHQRLWDRWEAIFAAWWATQQEIDAGLKAARKRSTRRTGTVTVSGPTFNWHTETGKP